MRGYARTTSFLNVAQPTQHRCWTSAINRRYIRNLQLFERGYFSHKLPMVTTTSIAGQSSTATNSMSICRRDSLPWHPAVILWQPAHPVTPVRPSCALGNTPPNFEHVFFFFYCRRSWNCAKLDLIEKRSWQMLALPKLLCACPSLLDYVK